MNHFPINTEKAAECSGAQLVSWMEYWTILSRLKRHFCVKQ